MKSLVLILSVYVAFYNVNAFEYHEEYNSAEDYDGKAWDEYYKALSAQPYYYGPVPYNEIPNEPTRTETKQEVAPEIPETTVAAANVQNDTKKKPYYEEQDAPELFRKFIKDFNKHYKDDDEYNKRLQNFARNLKEINKLNKEQDATFDINMFADLGEDEPVIG